VGVGVRVGVGDERFLAAALLAAVAGDDKDNMITGRVIVTKHLIVIVSTTPHTLEKQAHTRL
jgi:hypothetical protein